jgi:hypothetical protein
MAKKPYIIALEEHYQDPEVKQLSGGPGAGREIVERLDDLGALRIREMDEAGIDLQVLSHSIPGLQVVDAANGWWRPVCEQVTPRAPWEIRRTDLDAEPIRGIIDRLHRTGKLILQGGCAEDQLALFIENAGDDNARHHE